MTNGQNEELIWNKKTWHRERSSLLFRWYHKHTKMQLRSTLIHFQTVGSFGINFLLQRQSRVAWTTIAILVVSRSCFIGNSNKPNLTNTYTWIRRNNATSHGSDGIRIVNMIWLWTYQISTNWENKKIFTLPHRKGI